MNFFADAQVQKPWNITCISTFHLRWLISFLLGWPAEGSPLCLNFLSSHFRDTRESHTSGPLPAICRQATQEVCSKLIFATLHRGWARPPICSMLMPHNLHGPLLPVYLDWVSTIFFLSPEGSTTQGLQLHECLTPTTGLLEPRPKDICLLIYPKPPTSCDPNIITQLLQIAIYMSKKGAEWVFS